MQGSEKIISYSIRKKSELERMGFDLDEHLMVHSLYEGVSPIIRNNFKDVPETLHSWDKFVRDVSKWEDANIDLSTKPKPVARKVAGLGLDEDQSSYNLGAHLPVGLTVIRRPQNQDHTDGQGVTVAKSTGAEARISPEFPPLYRCMGVGDSVAEPVAPAFRGRGGFRGGFRGGRGRGRGDYSRGGEVDRDRQDYRKDDRRDGRRDNRRDDRRNNDRDNRRREKSVPREDEDSGSEEKQEQKRLKQAKENSRSSDRGSRSKSENK